jgi:protein-tyrosine-phosphatase
MRRVLFVCIGNACRSQMAEAFAHAYGRGIVSAEGAGLWPAGRIPQTTVELMLEKNISLYGCTPKGLEETGVDFDVIVNMSGEPLPAPASASVREWDVEDPVCLPVERQREIRDQIEVLVRSLLAELGG